MVQSEGKDIGKRSVTVCKFVGVLGVAPVDLGILFGI